MGLPTWQEDEAYVGEARSLTAELVVGGDGCAYVDAGDGAMVALWPPGSSLSQPVRLPDGTELADGDIVEAEATLVPFEALPGGPDGYWAHVTGFCAGEVPRAAVLERISSVR